MDACAGTRISVGLELLVDRAGNRSSPGFVRLRIAFQRTFMGQKGWRDGPFLVQLRGLRKIQPPGIFLRMLNLMTRALIPLDMRAPVRGFVFCLVRESRVSPRKLLPELAIRKERGVIRWSLSSRPVGIASTSPRGRGFPNGFRCA